MPSNTECPSVGLAVGAERLPGSRGEELTVLNPATARPIARVAVASDEDVDRTVHLAHDAFVSGPWPGVSARDRGAMLHQIASSIRDKTEILADIESRNVGKPIAAARAEMGLVAECFEYYAGAANKIFGSTIPVSANGTGLTLREPLGVCVLIVPWNYPLLVAAWKIAPALAMGNTIVVKPAETTPLSVLAIMEIVLEAGVPPGVMNVLPGPGPITGAALVKHDLVRKISFTGSTVVGSRIMQDAAHDIKRVSLELGGKSASVVFADADLDVCVASSIWAVFDNTGQDCCARSRILVQDSIFDRFVSNIADAAGSMRVGLPDEESTEMGPLISQVQHDRVSSFIEDARESPAELICGGGKPENEDLADGYYFSPTVYANVDPDSRLAQEEIFGPVVSVIPFKTEEDAIRIANSSHYGLSGSVWTRDIGLAVRAARALETGMVSINSSSTSFIEMPFGGVKRSGLGREHAMVALEYFSELKTIFIGAE